MIITAVTAIAHCDHDGCIATARADYGLVIKRPGWPIDPPRVVDQHQAMKRAVWQARYLGWQVIGPDSHGDWILLCPNHRQ